MSLTPSHTSPAFLEMMMRQRAPEQDIRVQAVDVWPLDNSASILAVLTAGHSDQSVGHFGLTVTLTAAGQPQVQRLVLKVKPHGRDVSAMLGGLAQAGGPALAAVYPPYVNRTGFYHTHHRELAVYAQHPEAALLPRIWGTYADESRSLYLILMEYLTEVDLLNSAMRPQEWTDAHLRAALSQLAAWHAQHLQPARMLPADAYDDTPSAAYMHDLAPLLQALVDQAATHFPHLYTPDRAQLLYRALRQLPAWQARLARFPRTLIHNDCNPRNACFRRTAAGPQLCLYDWELATYHVPQYDVVELLSFVLAEDRYHLRAHYLEHYRQALHALTNQYADAAAFREAFGLAALDFGLHRLGLYLMAHAVSPYPFLPRVTGSLFDTLHHFSVLAPTGVPVTR